MSTTRSRVLDRWAAQQARDMMTTIENQGVEPMPAGPSRDRSPAPSDSSSSDDLRVSTLVRKWRGYENKNQNQNQNQNLNTQNRDDGQINGVGASSVSETSTDNEMMVSDERFGVQSCSNNENQSAGDSESDRTTNSSDREGEERERMKVVDIIRKWTSTCQSRSVMGHIENDYDQATQQSPGVVPPQLARLRFGSEKGGNKNGACAVVCSPRLRGRQAIADLFMRMERERYKEIEGLSACHAVTKFPHRGRIQSMLRLRFLRHGGPVEDHWRRHPRARGSDRSQNKSKIENLRERLNQASQGNASMKAFPGTITESNFDIGKTSTSNQTSEETNPDESTCKETNYPGEVHHEVTNHNESSNEQVNHEVDICPQATNHHQESNKKDTNTHDEVNQREWTVEHPSSTTIVEVISLLNATEDCQEESTPSSEVVSQDHGHEACNMESQESYEHIEISFDDLEDGMIYEEEMESHDQHFLEANLDWINEISRPCSYWEDRRQAWYKEMVDDSSENEEIRQLIERKTVSAALRSAFRQRMDQLMMSCVERQMIVLHNEEEDDESREALIQRHIQSTIQEQQYQEQVELAQGREDLEQEPQEELEQEETRDRELNMSEEDNEHEQDEDEDDHEEQSPSRESYHESVGDYYDRTPSSSQLPWSHYHEDTDGSEQVGSTPFQQSSINNSYDHDTHEGSSFKNISTFEIELIYDLRAHMEQLYREMFELRTSIKSCMDMQVMMQNSIKEEVTAALRCSDKEKKGKNKKLRKKGNCCICYEKKVDALLYRCGHMCTCFKCAHELQWSSRKCPICRAEIADVVRAHLDM